LALVTASTKLQALAIIRKNKWENIFDVVLGYDEYKIKKPNPTSFLMAAERLNILPENCIVIEDSKNGTKAGKNAGMYVI
jgi:HAD superfamily hydrolase (TIGR01509 family)